MPVVEIWGVSGESQATLKQLRAAVVETCVGVEELRISDKDVSVFIIPDTLGSDPNGVALVRIRDLFRTHDRTTEVLEMLVALIGATVLSVLGTEWKKVEIPVIETIDPDSIKVTLRVWRHE